MRLYLSAISKNGIAYTPDTLMLESKNKEMKLDLCGDTDCIQPGLNTRTKGDFQVMNSTEEYVPCNSYYQRKLKQCLLIRQTSGFLYILLIAKTLKC